MNTQEHINTLKEVIEETKAVIEETKEAIEQDIKAMSKEYNKGSLHMVSFHNQSITRKFEQIAKHEANIEALKQELKIAEMKQGGFTEVVEYVHDIYKKDCEWHNNLKAEVAEKGIQHFKDLVKSKEMTKSVLLLAMMTTEEAQKIFFNDMVERVLKLKSQITEKVGTVETFNMYKNGNGSFDGLFTGTEGSCTVTTFGAGGYHIQRFHYRTKVTPVK